MTPTTNKVKSDTCAPLRNVALFLDVMEKQMALPSHISRFGVFSGPPGYGKTESAIFAANKHGAYHIECGFSWNRNTLFDAILHELGSHVIKGSVADKVFEAIRILYDDDRPLIIDEAHHLVKKSIIDLVRELHDKTMVPIILIGEAQLPRLMKQFEQVHSRVSTWEEAVPADFTDARSLADWYYPKLVIADDLLEAITGRTNGVARRIVNNLEDVNEHCKKIGLLEIGLDDWDLDSGTTGTQPRKRRLAPKRQAGRRSEAAA